MSSNILGTKIIYNNKTVQQCITNKNPSKIESYFRNIVVPLIVAFMHTVNGNISKGAVVANGANCAKIGVSILEQGGTAVEAAIATLFCDGVSVPYSLGLGGGCIMTIYTKETGKSEILDARETAPSGATKTMYQENNRLARVGGQSVAVPGELKAYWEAYQKYGGKIPWKKLVEPSIALCENGIDVTEHAAGIMDSLKTNLRRDPGLRQVFIDPSTDLPYTTNQKYKMGTLAKSLKVIAELGADALYNGPLTKMFVQDIQAQGGIITAQDMANYQIIWNDPVTVELPFNQKLHTNPLPGGGLILQFILHVLRDTLDFRIFENPTNYHKIIEAFKWGFSERAKLGDSRYVGVKKLVANLLSQDYIKSVRSKILDNSTTTDPAYYNLENRPLSSDHGTAHVCVLAPNGDAVSVTSTINLYFGAQFMSVSTGIILNNEMDDLSSPNITNAFNLPPSIPNYISPGKKPLSSMSPTIVTNPNGDVALIIGGAGGTRIITSIALVLIKHLWYRMQIQDAVNDKRFHHQLLPMNVQLEYEFNKFPDVIEYLRKIGHECKICKNPTEFYSVVNAIAQSKGSIEVATDFRRPGSAKLVVQIP